MNFQRSFTSIFETLCVNFHLSLISKDFEVEISINNLRRDNTKMKIIRLSLLKKMEIVKSLKCLSEMRSS